MWADGVVVNPPGLDDIAGFAGPVEQVLVETFVPKPSVERLDERILRRLAGGDIVPFDSCVLRPFQDRVTGRFRLTCSPKNPSFEAGVFA